MDNKFWRKENSDEYSAPDCSNHKKEIAGITDMNHLAHLIGQLHYESLAELFGHLQNKFWSDARKDQEAGRERLSDQLFDIAIACNNAKYHLDKAWQISKPFMKDHDQ